MLFRGCHCVGFHQVGRIYTFARDPRPGKIFGSSTNLATQYFLHIETNGNEMEMDHIISSFLRASCGT